MLYAGTCSQMRKGGIIKFFGDFVEAVSLSNFTRQSDLTYS
jgi:hypothetical protein